MLDETHSWLNPKQHVTHTQPDGLKPHYWVSNRFFKPAFSFLHPKKQASDLQSQFCRDGLICFLFAGSLYLDVVRDMTSPSSPLTSSRCVHTPSWTNRADLWHTSLQLWPWKESSVQKGTAEMHRYNPVIVLLLTTHSVRSYESDGGQCANRCANDSVWMQMFKMMGRYLTGAFCVTTRPWSTGSRIFPRMVFLIWFSVNLKLIYIL